MKFLNATGKVPLTSSLSQAGSIDKKGHAVSPHVQDAPMVSVLALAELRRQSGDGGEAERVPPRPRTRGHLSRGSAFTSHDSQT